MKVDHPQSFYDISWLAVRNGDPQEVMNILQLSDPKPSTWSMGLEAVCGDFWDFDEQSDVQFSRVFVTPKVNGWLLVIGGWLVGAGEDGVREIAHYCKRLSEIYGEACAFTSQGRMDLYSWVLAKDGEITRMFEWDGDVNVDEGEPTPVERQLRESDSDWAPGEVDVMTIAGEVSIDPGRLGPDTVAEGTGFITTTAPGRINGVPQRQLHKGVTVFLSDDREALEAGQKPAPLSTDEVRLKISELVPDVDWSQVGAGVSAAEHVEFVVGEEGELTSFRVFLCGGGDPFTLLSDLCEANGWSAVDDQSGRFLERQDLLLT